MRTYTISEAAELTGLSRKAISRRVERGSLRSVVRNGRRRVPRSELVRAGLVADADEGAPELDPGTLLLPRPAPAGPADAPAVEDLLVALVRELLDRVERQASEMAQMRALTVQAESLRLTNELTDLRVRMAELERERPEPAPPPAATDFGRRISELSKQVEKLAQREIWLPPHAERRQSAVAPHPRPAAPAYPASEQPAVATPARPRPTSPRLGRTIRFLLEATFIVAVAVAAWRADLAGPAIAGTLGAAWVIVAVIEALAFRRAS